MQAAVQRMLLFIDYCQKVLKIVNLANIACIRAYRYTQREKERQGETERLIPKSTQQ